MFTGNKVHANSPFKFNHATVTMDTIAILDTYRMRGVVLGQSWDDIFLTHFEALNDSAASKWSETIAGNILTVVESSSYTPETDLYTILDNLNHKHEMICVDFGRYFYAE